jgi:tetratricopeptide (TPR) repeat protein
MNLSKPIIVSLLLSCFSCKQTTRSEKEAASLADSARRQIYSLNRPESLHKAVRFADQSIELNDSRPLAYELKATALSLLQKPDLAIEPLTDWLSKHPDDSEFLVKRGLIYEKLGKSTEAGKDFTSISKLLEARVPKITSGMTEKEIGVAVTAATVYFLIGKPDSASGILSSLQKAFPNDLKIKNAATEIRQHDRDRLIYSILGF